MNLPYEVEQEGLGDLEVLDAAIQDGSDHFDIGRGAAD